MLKIRRPLGRLILLLRRPPASLHLQTDCWSHWVKIWWANTLQASASIINFWMLFTEFPPFSSIWLVDQFLHICRQTADQIELKFGRWTHHGTLRPDGPYKVWNGYNCKSQLWFAPTLITFIRGCASIDALNKFLLFWYSVFVFKAPHLIGANYCVTFHSKFLSFIKSFKNVVYKS